jgi:hypothetical protein
MWGHVRKERDQKEHQNAPFQLRTPIEEGFGKPSFFARFFQFPRVLF